MKVILRNGTVFQPRRIGTKTHRLANSYSHEYLKTYDSIEQLLADHDADEIQAIVLNNVRFEIVLT